MVSVIEEALNVESKFRVTGAKPEHASREEMGFSK